MKRILFIICGLLLLGGGGLWLTSEMTRSTGSDRAVCGAFGLEDQAFTEWQRIAWRRGNDHPDPDGYTVTPVSVMAADGYRLAGYRMAWADGPANRRALLMILGNAMLASQVKRGMTAFARAGYDVYVFDHRGYADGRVKPRLAAITEDYARIARFIHDRKYDHTVLFGVSFGAIVSLAPTGVHRGFDRVVLDSGLARLPGYGMCPGRYDPLENLPVDASRFLAIVGVQDRVLPPSDMIPLGQAIRDRGGRFVLHPDLGHGFADGRFADRIRLVLEHAGVAADKQELLNKIRQRLR